MSVKLKAVMSNIHQAAMASCLSVVFVHVFNFSFFLFCIYLFYYYYYFCLLLFIFGLFLVHFW